MYLNRLMTDGGAASIVTKSERARAPRHRPVYLLGQAGAACSREVLQIPDFAITPTAESAPRAKQMAGITKRDVAVALNDAFTINKIMFLEDIGFCLNGEGGRFVEGGRIAWQEAYLIRDRDRSYG